VIRLALVRRDLVRVLWRPRSLLLLAYLGVAAWAGASVPYVAEGDGLRPIGTALTDAIPNDFSSDWTLVAVQALPLVLLAAALIVEDRSDGGTWMTVHRAGGVRPWWSSKALAAVALATSLVLVSAVLVLAAALVRGWDLTLAVSEYARAGPALGYGRIGGTSPLAETLIVVLLRIAVLSAVALLAGVVALAIRRPAAAYALPIIVMIGYWRLMQSDWIEHIALRGDLLRQAFWDQHGPGYDVPWAWTPAVVALWTLAALALGRLVVSRVEVTTT
jgi:hypothetical protein